MNKIVTYGDQYRKYYKVDDRTYYTYDDAVRDYKKYYQMVDPIEESKEEREAREKAEKREKRINMILGE